MNHFVSIFVRNYVNKFKTSARFRVSYILHVLSMRGCVLQNLSTKISPKSYRPAAKLPATHRTLSQTSTYIDCRANANVTNFAKTQSRARRRCAVMYTTRTSATACFAICDSSFPSTVANSTTRSPYFKSFFASWTASTTS